ncbi:GAF domain-containing protein [Kribbella sp. NBC_01484]|uniref:sigma-54-dependent Fis family transcriptional regulator n=1 Tax=Kribbella sp. NBC_01484 TaxID=2903579 RepID=UPI002E3260B6|nr:helix-turn-helix domain-containing protein [Kribbella sp. NBC_01484]
MSAALPVRDPIRVSWERSHASQVDVDRPAPKYFDRIDRETTLMRAARPVIDALSSELTNEPVCIILTDAKGVVLDRRGGDPSLLRRLDSVDLAPGFRYAESEVGTNGIGTALEVGGPILIHGPEHYNDKLRMFSCAGAPITHPVTGGLLGVLDITTQARNSNSILLSFAKLAARRIHERVVEEANALDHALLSDYYAACRHSGGPVLALGDEVFMMNAYAQARFDAVDQAALIDRTRDARGGTKPLVILTDLPSGTTARLAYRPTFLGDTLAGGVIQIKEQRPPARSQQPARAPLVPGTTGSSAVWQHVTQEMLDACRRSEWLIADGEPGAGKLSLLRAVRRHVSPDRRLAVLDPAVTGDDLPAEARAELESGSDLIIRRANLLTGEVLYGLTDVLQSVRDGAIAGDAWVALTLPADRSEIADQLLAFFPRTVEVPPLRHHLEDIPALVRSLLAKAGVSGLTFSTTTMNQLMRLPWAGNITHLRAALTAVAKRRRSGVVELADLPPECRATTRRQLTPIEALERDAIVDALSMYDGDKQAAAAALGMSRATIYRKIRDYGIVT